MSDASGCTFSQAFVISQPSALSQTSSVTSVSCYGGSNGSAQLTVNGGTQPYSYAWNNGTSNAVLSNVIAGTYSCLVTDANGCESSSQVIVTTPTQLSASMSIQQPSCNAANGSIQLNVQGGVGTYNYLWNTGGVNSSLNGLLAGNYQVTITDQNACSISLNETLVSLPSFSVAVDGDTLICFGEEVQLEARASGIHTAYNYFWNHGVTGSQFTATPSETTTYIVTVQDSLGCVAQDSITIHVNQLPVVSIVADANEGCAPFCTNLHAVSLTATTFNWNLSNGAFYSGADVSPCFNLPGSYTIEMAAKDDAGCSAIVNWDGVIQVNASPQANFTVSDDDVSLDEPTIEFNNHSIGADDFTYYFGDSYQGSSNYSNTTYTYRDSGNYEVMLVVENAFGCSDTAFHNIHIGGLTSFYIPTSFSPSNYDGLNDEFMPKSIGMSETGFTMSIYDRWGHLVFESNSWSKGWDGFINGTPVQQDVYVCKVRYRELSGRINEAIGSVTVAE
jgi:gliding motility-associated-like protein